MIFASQFPAHPALRPSHGVVMAALPKQGPMLSRSAFASPGTQVG